MRSHMTVMAALLVASLASARVAAPPPVPLRVAAADATFVGKVIGFGPKMVPAALEKGDDRQMQVAEVEVTSDLLGRVGKKVKVGFFPPGAGGGRRGPAVELEVKEEALFMVRKHPTLKDTYVAEMYHSVVRGKDNPELKAQAEEAAKAAKLLADPSKGLRSKDADERFLTTALVITRYRTAPPGTASKTETVSAEESKLLLTNLATADWSGRAGRFGFQMTPLNLFFQLGVTDRDGWKPTPRTNIQEAAKQWLKDNAGKYRIQRLVRPDAGKSVEP